MTQPREIPILRNANQVRAILAGATQIRVPVKKQPKLFQRVWRWRPRKNINLNIAHVNTALLGEYGPFGAPGDLLYCKEMWRVYSWHEGEPINVTYQDGKVREAYDPHDSLEFDHWSERMFEQSSDDCKAAGWLVPRDTGCYQHPEEGHDDDDAPTRWRSSTTMPKWVSRIHLRVTRVWCQQVQSISYRDCLAETALASCESSLPAVNTYTCAHSAFRGDWDRDYDKKFPWSSNPWIFGCEVERIDKC